MDFVRKNKEYLILMAGLDETGKTRILECLRPFHKETSPIKTIGFDVENFIYKNINITILNIGGRDKIRPLWRHYYENTHGLIFVVDSFDQRKLIGAKDELWSLLCEVKLTNAPILILTNNDNVEGALSIEEIVIKLGLNLLIDRIWKVNKIKDLLEGLEWMLKLKIGKR